MFKFEKQKYSGGSISLNENPNVITEVKKKENERKTYCDTKYSRGGYGMFFLPYLARRRA